MSGDSNAAYVMQYVCIGSNESIEPREMYPKYEYLQRIESERIKSITSLVNIAYCFKDGKSLIHPSILTARSWTLVAN